MGVFTVTGATGSIGKEVVKNLLSSGHEVRILSTRKELQWKGVSVFYWNPAKGEIDDLALEGSDYLIHLAGASVSKRWTPMYKRKINDSRVYTSKVLLDAINNVKKGPKSCVSASAIGYYGSSSDKVFKEHTPPANDFLASITKNWERYTRMFESYERRSVQLRIGIVLDKGAGVLGKLVPLAKAGVVSPLGSGEQWISWIHVEDLAKMFIYCAISDVASGPYNAVASTPLSNKSFTKKICKVLKRPMILPSVPAFLLKLFLGEMATLALMSQKVSNAKILKTGFVFKYEEIEPAIQNILN
ncbi:MAG: TIGR01777 family oxidoreductase [Bacteroidota bacterium]|nr:TIGR01777 family oxidoreductase [Bacteroidota bacterium]